MWLPVIALCVWSLGEHVRPVDSAHFMGGLIYWRPVNQGAFDGRVRACSTEQLASFPYMYIANPAQASP